MGLLVAGSQVVGYRAGSAVEAKKIKYRAKCILPIRTMLAWKWKVNINGTPGIFAASCLYIFFSFQMRQYGRMIGICPGRII